MMGRTTKERIEVTVDDMSGGDFAEAMSQFRKSNGTPSPHPSIDARAHRI